MGSQLSCHVIVMYFCIYVCIFRVLCFGCPPHVSPCVFIYVHAPGCFGLLEGSRSRKFLHWRQEHYLRGWLILKSKLISTAVDFVRENLPHCK